MSYRLKLVVKLRNPSAVANPLQGSTGAPERIEEACGGSGKFRPPFFALFCAPDTPHVESVFFVHRFIVGSSRFSVVE